MRQAALALTVVVGCWNGGNGGLIIVEIGEESFSQADFDQFVAPHAAFAPEPGPPVLSGLLDEFIQEHLLAIGAREAGVAVEADAVAAEVAALERAPAYGDAEPGALRAPVRRRMLVKRFLDEVVLGDLEVSAADLDLELTAFDALYFRPATVTLSEAHFATRAEADRAVEAPEVEFQRAGVFREGELPAHVEDAVRGVAPGERTGVLETASGFSVFRVDRRDEAGELSREDAEPVAYRVMLERRADARIADLLADLRVRHPVTVLAGRLSFPYLGRERTEGSR